VVAVAEEGAEAAGLRETRVVIEVGTEIWTFGIDFAMKGVANEKENGKGIDATTVAGGLQSAELAHHKEIFVIGSEKDPPGQMSIGLGEILAMAHCL
jgi:hypothetical protein